jgi:protein AFG1
MHGTVGTGKTMLMDLFYATVEDPRKRRVHFHAFMNSVHQSISCPFLYYCIYGPCDQNAPAHSGIHQLKAGSGGGETPDIIPRIAAQWSRTAWLLCFDEFQVTDIADAMILRVLMEELHARGIVMVATSNRAPDGISLPIASVLQKVILTTWTTFTVELYSNGIQRESFVPCIALIKRSCKTLNLNSDTDYRRLSKLCPSISSWKLT